MANRVPDQEVYVGQIFGIRVRVNGVFLLLALAFFVTGLGAHAMVLVVSVLGHEMAHALAASGFGLRPRQIEIYPFGGTLEFDGDWGDLSTEAVVALAGPLHNLALAASFWWLSDLSLWRPGALDLFIETNLILGLFNLIPVLPLDGGKVIRSMIASRMGYRRATSLMARRAKIVSVLFMVSGSIMLYLGWLAGVNVLVIGGFLLMAADRERRSAAFLVMMEMAGKKETLLKKGQIPLRQVMVHEDTPMREVAKGFTPGRYHLVIVVDDGFRIMGKIPEARLMDFLLKKGGNIPVKHLLKCL